MPQVHIFLARMAAGRRSDPYRWVFASQEWNQSFDLPDQLDGLALAKGGKLVFALDGQNNSLLGLDILSGLEQFTLMTASSHPFSTLAATPDGKRAVVAHYDHYLRVWELDRAKKQQVQSEAVWVQEIKLLPGAHRAIVWLENDRVEVYDVSTGFPDTNPDAREALQAAIQEFQARQAQMESVQEEFIKPAVLARSSWGKMRQMIRFILDRRYP